jgi:NTP pyrophosphatase (non-canonical NTP hydrolase)
MKSEFESLLDQIQQFSEDRDWAQFHTPKNLILAISAEVGELSEVIQWKSDVEIADYLLTPEGKKRISEEIADIAIYLIRLCQQQGLSFVKILDEKIENNAKKYPIEKAKGNARKYNELGKQWL